MSQPVVSVKTACHRPVQYQIGSSRQASTNKVCIGVVAEAEVEYRDRLGNWCCLSVSTRPSKDHSHQATCMQPPDSEIYFGQKEAKLVSRQKLGGTSECTLISAWGMGINAGQETDSMVDPRVVFFPLPAFWGREIDFLLFIDQGIIHNG